MELHTIAESPAKLGVEGKRSLITSERVRRYLIGVVVLAALAQAAIHPSPANLVCVAIAAISTAITTWVLLRVEVMRVAPISTLQVLMFAWISQGFAILGTLFEGKSLVYSLQVPYQTFGWIANTQATLLVAHWYYRRGKLQRFRSLVTRRVLEPIGLFRQPYAIQLWAMGFVGSAAMLIYSLSDVGKSTRSASPGVLMGVVQALVSFTYAPYLISILGYFMLRKSHVSRLHYPALAAYFCLNVLLAVGRNSRGAFMFGLTGIAAAAAVALLLGQLKIPRIRWSLVIVVVLVAVPIGSAMSDLAIAMQLARAQRGELPMIELMQVTQKLFFQKKRLDDYRRTLGLQAKKETMAGAQSESDAESARREITTWEESYTHNVFLNRFINVKFHDNAFNLIQYYKDYERRFLRRYSLARVMAILPGPVLKLFGMGNLKRSVQVGSVGDMMYYLGTKRVAFGYKTGSLIAHGVAMFGYFYPLLLGPLACIVFVVTDSFVRRVTPEEAMREGVDPSYLMFSCAILLGLYLHMMMFSAESLVTLVSAVTRGLLQLVILYSGLYHGTRFLRHFVGSR
jgi:hypothetical protein